MLYSSPWCILSAMEPLYTLIGAAASGAVASFALAQVLAVRRGVSTAAARHGNGLPAEADTTRLLRLAAAELRELAFNLLGHTDRLRLDQTAAHADSIVAATTRFLALADELQDAAVPADHPPSLREQLVPVGELLQASVAVIGASLGPGRRNWRIAPELTELVLIADPRALSQVLLRVLANAARFTRDGDWIELTLERHEAEVALVVADEGAGPPALAGEASIRRDDRRGVALGLALARSLMDAHGGSLTIDAAPRVGTRVRLGFPAQRVAPG